MTKTKRKTKPRVEKRSTYQTPAQWLMDVLVGEKTSSGQAVNEATALNVNVVFACVRNLAEDIAKLPLKLYRKISDDEREEATNNPLYALLAKRPNGDMTKMDFWQASMIDVLLGGNSYSEIQKNGAGLAVALNKMCRSKVTPKRNELGQIVYEYRADDQSVKIFAAADVLHIRGIGDGLMGWSIIKLARESIGGALAAEKNGNSFFGNNSLPSGVLKHKGKLDPKAYDNLRKSWEAIHGGAENKGKVAILEDGLEFSAMSITPEDAQFIETRQFQVEDLCRWFRMPPHKVGYLQRAQGWSTLEASNTDYKTDTLQPWTERIEQEIERKLLPVADKDLYVEHNFDALLRADTAARATFYREQFNIGAISQNEIRKLENRNPIGPEGDTYYVPLNMVPSEIAVEGPQKPEAVPAPTKEPPSDPAQRLKLIEKTYVELLSEVFRRVLTIQRDRVSKHIGRADFHIWSKSFYEEHQLHVHGAIGGVVEAFVASGCALLGKNPQKIGIADVIGKEIDHISIRHTQASLSALSKGVEMRRMENWTDRAEEEARNEIAAVSKLILDFTGDKS